MRFVLPLILLVLLPSTLHAQSEVWFFGDSAGVDFRSGMPVVLGDGAINAVEGSATISDPRTGMLLFYTDGITVWNRLHTPMPNGVRLAGHPSSAQSVLIVPDPADENRYYVFTTDEEGYAEPPNTGLHYSVVDMRDDGGLGDVVEKNLPLLAQASEKLVAVAHPGGRHYWVIAHSLGMNTFYAWLVSPGGIGPPVISTVGTPQGTADKSSGESSVGYLKASPDGRMLALGCNAPPIGELYRFDPCSGAVSDPILLDGFPQAGPYGVSFSPDNSKLYLTARHGSSQVALHQFDVSSGDPAVINRSRTLIDTFAAPEPAALQLAPDGRIYMAVYGREWLDVIEQPNLPGQACGYRSQAVDLGTSRCWLGLPNAIDAVNTVATRCVPLADFALADTLLCAGDCIDIVDMSVGASSRQWRLQGVDPRSDLDSILTDVCYPAVGRYAVTLIVENAFGADTATKYVSVVEPVAVEAGDDVLLCAGQTAQLRAVASGGEPLTYRWSPALGLSCSDCPDPIADPAVTTEYIVEVQNASGCLAADTLTVMRGRLVAAASIDRNHIAEPGGGVLLPVRLDDPLDAAEVSAFTLKVAYDPKMLRPTTHSTEGTLLDGWSVRAVPTRHGLLELRCEAVVPGARLAGVGTVIRLGFDVFLADVESSELRFEIELDDPRCTEIIERPGAIAVELCGVQHRLVELFAGRPSTTVNGANPSAGATAIELSLVDAAAVSIQLFDAAGRSIRMLLDGHLEAGTHHLAVDLADVPSGVYHYRILAGGWVGGGRIVVQR